MVERVFIHIGLPKTATTYLQSILWSGREDLAAQGVVLPGREHGDHRWASRNIRDHPNLDKRPQQQRNAWHRIRRELRQSAGTGLISHELLTAATVEQARRMVRELPTDDVHVIVTAREPLGLFTASWQEHVKIGATTRLADYGGDDASSVWNWETLDLGPVLERWSQAVAPDRIHVLPLDPGAAKDDIWRRFAGVVGIVPSGIEVADTSANTSLGVAEVETLRRINAHLTGTWTGFDRGSLIRRFLAEQRMVPRKGERFWPEAHQVEDCRRRGEAAIEQLRSRPYDIVGDPEHLRVPAELPERRLTGSVTDSEVAEVATELVATLLDDVRQLRRQKGPAGAQSDGRSGPARTHPAADDASAPRRAARRALDRLPDRRRRQVVRLVRRLRRG